MRSNYKRLGNYIRQVSVRNQNVSVTALKGISINKVFMPSVANTTDTDLSKYRVVKRGQFAYNPMHVGRDEVLPISLLEDDEAVIVSPAYVVFEVIDPNELIPEYLMMWCRRSEFDRNAWFTTDSSVRGGFSWDDFCDMELPIPSIEKQREIVREYHTITERIRLNEQLNQKLEETAQSIYRQWFVEFEFPDENGKPYKSSGGEMEWCPELEQEIPKGWEATRLTGMIHLSGGGTPKTDIPEYWGVDIPFFTGKDVTENYYSVQTEKSITKLGLSKCSSKLYPKDTTFVVSRGATTGVIALAGQEMAMNQSCYAFVSDNKEVYFCHQTLLYVMERLKSTASGSTFNALVTKDYDDVIAINPPQAWKIHFNSYALPIYEYLHNKTLEILSSKKLLDTLLSKMATIEDKLHKQKERQ